MFLFCVQKAYKTQNQKMYYLHRGEKITISCQKKKFWNLCSGHIIKQARATCQSQHKNLTPSTLLPSRPLSPTNYHDLYHSTILFHTLDAQLPSSKDLAHCPLPHSSFPAHLQLYEVTTLLLISLKRRKWL